MVEQPEEPEGVREVRAWRQKMRQSWEGKSREEIIRELNEAGERMQEDIRHYQSTHKTGSAPQRP
ncbi:MAG: hypothetical protein ACYCW6_24110 [Candidatus Xenobia bacterium]